MNGSEIFGAWVAVFLTLGIFSYLYKDNPFYKIAEHVFVGVSAGYWMTMAFWTQVQPNLFGRLWPIPEGEISGFLMKAWYGIYNIFGFVSSKLSWLARLGIAYTVGMAAGLRAYAFLNSNVLGQIKGSAVSFVDMPWFSLTGVSVFNNLIILVGTITGLLYFYFSKEHSGHFGKVTRVGIYFLMISFGASFGFAVMGRISLLIGRFTDLITYGTSTYSYASIWVLLIMIVLLVVWTIKGEKKTVS
jgi:hypothetical protein